MSNNGGTPPTSPQDLYPVVHDLTEAECGNACCCESALGTFTFEDLVMPITPPRSLPPTPSATPKQDDRKKHQRSMSLSYSATPATTTMENKDGPSGIHLRRRTATGTTLTHSTLHSDETSATFSSTSEAEERVTESCRFEDSYVLTRQIYRCNISSIWECIDREEGTHHCVKIVDRRRFTTRHDETCTLREIAMLASLQSISSRTLPESWVRTRQVTEDVHQYYIVMDLEGETNLSSQMATERSMSEAEVKRMTFSLLRGLEELHKHKIGHFDVQPENILLRSQGGVCLCDFGSARYLNDIESPTKKVRTNNLNYTAPEIVRTGRGGIEADLWSVGVIVYYCLSGQLPFDVSQDAHNSNSSSTTSSRVQLKDRIKNAEYSFAGEHWQYPSRSAKQFISSLLYPDPTVRLTASEAMEHPWLSKSHYSSSFSPMQSESSRQKRNLVQRIFGRLKSPASPGRRPPRHPKHPHRRNVSNDSSTLSTTSTKSESLYGGGPRRTTARHRHVASM